jgi:hypothetical protein
MKLTITHINKMLEKGQLECIDYEIVGAYVCGEYKITEKGFKTLSKKMLNYITNESKNNS